MSRWAAVLAGGSGTRFWPLSTDDIPKQMLALTGQAPLIVQACHRLRGLVPPERTLVVTGRRLAAETKRLLPEIPSENVLGEPRPASTAPALAWATWVASQRDPEATILSLHADWYVCNDAEFRNTAAAAMDAAERHDTLVTVGIKPSRPETGYGYIQPGAQLDGDVTRVERFLEKPDEKRATALIEAGALWNSGLFAWTARRFMEETKAVAPELAPHLALLEDGDDGGFFAAVTPVAVDVSHFERSDHVACVPGRFRWDDVGTWAALARVRDSDPDGNVLVGSAFVRESKNCVVWTEDGAVVLDGIDDLVVVRANKVTLVTTRQRAAHLKDLLQSLPAEIRKPEQ